MTREELYGMDFDWFALDKNNNIALISSAGYGDIPDTIIQNYEDYANLSESVYTRHYDTVRTLWEHYANYGLFVYEWDAYHGPYKKMIEPLRDISEELKKRIRNIPNIPKLSVDFYESKIINII